MDGTGSAWLSARCGLEVRRRYDVVDVRAVVVVGKMGSTDGRGEKEKTKKQRQKII